MSTENEQKKAGPVEGSPCWIEIPARNLEKVKVIIHQSPSFLQFKDLT
jgi:hypothetical protein